MNIVCMKLLTCLSLLFSVKTKDSCVCPICGKEFPKKQIEVKFMQDLWTLPIFDRRVV